MLPSILISSIDACRLEALVSRLAFQDSAGRALMRELDRAEVAEPCDLPPTVVSMNSTVRFVVEDTRAEFTLTLVYPKDAAVGGQRLSVLSPIGTALLGLSVDDVIEWPTPAGILVSLRVLDVLYQPERTGDFLS